ncbi:MAG: primosomal protein N', partial [Deltaproteobacteria bacterium]|nr:primosomal protein N' [Deltaproteobacteria bacterium]
EKKGWVIIEEKTSPGRAGPLMRKFVRPKDHIDLQEALSHRAGSSRAKNESEFLKALFGTGSMLVSELTGRFSNGSYLVEKWVKKGILVTYSEPLYRNPAGEIIFPNPIPHTLFEQQERAIHHIHACLDAGGFSSCLLYGVTGSGKTEVYFRAVEQVIGLGRQAILMAPEISLAVYLEGLFRARLGHGMAIYHSRLSQGERYDQWMRMVRGKVDLVIGARSALFAPLPRLGLIIVDEEHDFAYKQENSPRYQARDTALVRGKMEKALVILGSGTPSVQSFHNSTKGRHHLLSMPERAEKRPLPDVEIVDMKALEDKKAKSPILSPRLIEALGQNLIAGNQTILFLNRRGFHRLYLCRFCGRSIRCPNCDVALTHHRRGNRLQCHYCGFYSAVRSQCSSCGKEGLKAYGFGTEKLEHELKGLFPEARSARMDADSTRRKGQALQILKRFSHHELDILMGTQMITKGYHFPGVTLVGVIAADLSLAFPDFRAGERTFQILSQVAGRSGRGKEKGRVIIQTFNPGHYAIHTAVEHDYPSFYQKDRELREQLGYPPFSHLACLRLKGNNREETAQGARHLSREIKEVLAGWRKRGKEIQVLGPVEAPISRLKGKYRWQILVKCKSVSLLNHFLTRLEGISRAVLKSKGVHLTLDMDPYQMV